MENSEVELQELNTGLEKVAGECKMEISVEKAKF